MLDRGIELDNSLDCVMVRLTNTTNKDYAISTNGAIDATWTMSGDIGSLGTTPNLTAVLAPPVLAGRGSSRLSCGRGPESDGNQH